MISSKKFEDFPPVFCVNLESCVDRRENLSKQFSDVGVHDIYYGQYKKYKEYDYSLRGSCVHMLQENSKGPVTSHIKINQHWTQNTDHDYAFICEDDLGIHPAKYWNFTFKELINKLPKDWGCIQLSYLREDLNYDFYLRKRYYYDFGCQAYLISRKYAEEMVKRYLVSDNVFNLEIPFGWINTSHKESVYYKVYPIVENIVFETIGQVYSFPIFVEDFDNTNSTFTDCPDNYRFYCNRMIRSWWKNAGKNKELNNLITV